MAGLWCEDCQRLTTAQLTDGLFAERAAAWSVSTANPRTGTKHLRATSSAATANYLRRVFGEPKADGAGVGFGFYVPSLPVVETQFAGIVGLMLGGFLDAGGTVQAVCVLGTDGSLVLWRGYDYSDPNGGGFTVVDRSDPCVTANSYGGIEMFCAVDGFEARVNGVTRLNYSGDLQVGNAEVSQFFTRGPNSLTGVATFDIDDLHAWDTLAGEGPSDFVGNCSVINRRLNGDTAVADMAKSTGSVGWSLLRDADDATAIIADTVGQRSRFTGEDVSAAATGVVYQQVNYRAKKDDSGDCNLTPRIVMPDVSPVTFTDCVERQLTTAETWRWGIVGNNPTTAMPFTPEEAATSQIEFERTL
jgi:hypothetical protein